MAKVAMSYLRMPLVLRTALEASRIDSNELTNKFNPSSNKDSQIELNEVSTTHRRSRSQINKPKYIPVRQQSSSHGYSRVSHSKSHKETVSFKNIGIESIQN